MSRFGHFGFLGLILDILTDGLFSDVGKAIQAHVENKETTSVEKPYEKTDETESEQTTKKNKTQRSSLTTQRRVAHTKPSVESRLCVEKTEPMRGNTSLKRSDLRKAMLHKEVLDRPLCLRK